MIEGQRMKVGIDYDGVVIKKAKDYDLYRRATKFALPTLPGVLEGLDVLRNQSDVDVMGIYTVRPEWLRRGQTDRQVRRRNIPIERITHTTNSSKAKIEALLEDSLLGWGPNTVSEFSEVGRVVLIDDSAQKIVDGAQQLYDEKPGLRHILERFTLVAFNPKQPERLKGMIIPGVVHVVSMQSWKDVGRMLNEVRALA